MADALRDTWMVATALMADTSGNLLLVENLRRGGTLDWSPPGGVVDPGESTLEALSREVVEETGLEVVSWSPLAYAIDVEFRERRWTLRVEAYVAMRWTGQLTMGDPDGIVQQARFAEPAEVHSLLGDAPPWVREPLTDWIATTSPATHTYVVGGHSTTFGVMDRQRSPLQP